MKTEIINRIKLSLIPGVGHLLARHLVVTAGSASNLFTFQKSQLTNIPGLGEVVSNHLLKHLDYQARATDEYEFLMKYNISILFFDDVDYPYRLNECPDPPFVLFYKGTQPLNSNRFISIVGTRKASNYGRDFINHLIEGLKPYNTVIVSGLAYGIDIHAHEECLKHNVPTIGVVAHGHDRIYPSVHKNTASKMKLNGGILTEFLCHTNPDRENFPKRNRIIAGMCDATIVIEAAEKGGALITGNLAFDYGREVMALPGRRKDIYSIGCNNLIKRQKANLITHIDDVINILGWEKQKTSIQTNIFDEMNIQQKQVFELIRSGCSFIEDLTRKIQLTFSQTQSLLFEMEMNGWIRKVPGNRVELVQ